MDLMKEVILSNYYILATIAKFTLSPPHPQPKYKHVVIIHFCFFSESVKTSNEKISDRD